jgi:hypothetical protein
MKREAFMNRRNLITILSIIFLTLTLPACAPMPVLNPLFSDSEWLFEPKLLGIWEKMDPENKSFCSFHDFDAQAKSYKVDFDNKNEAGWLGKIGDNHYLDIVSVEQTDLPNKGLGELEVTPTAKGYQVKPAVVVVSSQVYLDFTADNNDQAISAQSAKIRFNVRPLHKIYRLKLENDQLTIWYLDDEKFVKQIEAGKIKLAYQKEPFSMITANRSELQEFLRTYGESEELFKEMGTYRRAVIEELESITSPQPGM